MKRYITSAEIRRIPMQIHCEPKKSTNERVPQMDPYFSLQFRLPTDRKKLLKKFLSLLERKGKSIKPAIMCLFS